MLRVLVVEDHIKFYQNYMLRFFGKLLPMEKISLVHVPTLNAALVALLEPWDMIFMDYSLGAKTEFLGDPVLDGADLVSFRRSVEETKDTPHAFILGTASNSIGNLHMLDRGADHALLKNKVPEMAKLVRGALEENGRNKFWKRMAEDYE